MPKTMKKKKLIRKAKPKKLIKKKKLLKPSKSQAKRNKVSRSHARRSLARKKIVKKAKPRKKKKLVKKIVKPGKSKDLRGHAKPKGLARKKLIKRSIKKLASKKLTPEPKPKPKKRIKLKKPVLDILVELDIPFDDQTKQIIEMLDKGKPVSENKIANILDEKFNAVRKKLYRLNSLGIITYFKKRDPKKKWWYLYYWTLDKERIANLYLEHKRKTLEDLKNQLIDEQNYCFECKPCEKRYEYNDALDSDFSCPECGGVLTEIKSYKVAKQIKDKIEELEKELVELEKP